MHEHKRKIIKIGESSYGVILPIAWLRYNQMDEHSRVKVVSNDRIIISKCRDESGISNPAKNRRER